MDSKNVIAAIALSSAVIVLYSLFFVPDRPPVNQKLAEKEKIQKNTDTPSIETKENVIKISREEALKDREGTIETLERQLVQAGIKGKVMQAEMEITKAKEGAKTELKKQSVESEGKHKLLQNVMQNEVNTKSKELQMAVNAAKKDLQSSDKKQ